MRKAPRKRSCEKRTTQPGGSSTPPEDPDRSSSIALPPGPTAWWKWRCELCRELPFVARARPAVDGSGRDQLYVWDYEASPRTFPTPEAEWQEVERGKPPPCPHCGAPGIVSPVGPAEFPDDLQVAYDALKRMLRARPKGPKPSVSPWPGEAGDDGDLPGGGKMRTDWIGVDE